LCPDCLSVSSRSTERNKRSFSDNEDAVEFAQKFSEKPDRATKSPISAQVAMVGIQARALEEGMPYQTLIASILHKYLNGRLVEKQN
jgi:predicted DNA binding CopG/RHH family protein